MIKQVVFGIAYFFSLLSLNMLEKEKEYSFQYSYCEVPASDCYYVRDPGPADVRYVTDIQFDFGSLEKSSRDLFSGSFECEKELTKTQKENLMDTISQEVGFMNKKLCDINRERGACYRKITVDGVSNPFGIYVSLGYVKTSLYEFEGVYKEGETEYRFHAKTFELRNAIGYVKCFSTDEEYGEFLKQPGVFA